jgi:hypothetical protein
MSNRKPIRKRQREAGIALLIAIFILLLIGVIGIALVISSGTESALALNYRSSTGVYYSAVAGLEEARARLRPNSPNYFGTTNPNNFLPPAGTPLGLCNPVYVLNPLGGEAVTPWDPANLYYDNQFGQELGAICGGGPGGPPPNPSPTANSMWKRAPLNGLPFPGPSYKWVRINGVSEQSLNVDTWPTYDGISPSLIYYDGQHLLDTNSGHQVYELTALAVLPNGSRKLVQYLVGRAPLTLPPFLAALTLSGNNGGGSPTFQAPANNAVYAVKGNDFYCNGNPTGSMYAAIGLFGPYTGSSYNSDLGNIVNGIPAAVGASHPRNNYTGSGPAPPFLNPPDVEFLSSYPANMQTPAQLDAVATAITQNADVTLPSATPSYPLPTVAGSALNSLGMSAANPMTVVINGNLDVTNWTGTGYGTLLVIGTFTYDPATTWNGIVLVIGQGQINNVDIGQYQQMSGAVFVAKTRDPVGNLLGGIGGGSVSFSDQMQGNGIRYSSCWIQAAMPTTGYKILSFHEISQ